MAQPGALACTERMDIDDRSGPCAAGIVCRIEPGDDGVFEAWNQPSRKYKELRKFDLFRTVRMGVV